MVKQLCSSNEHKTDWKWKWSQEAEYPQVQDESIEKWAWILLESCAVENQETVSDTDNKKGDLIKHWIQKGSWPKEYFKQEISMDTLLAWKKSLTSLHYQVLKPSTVTPSQETGDKSAPYKGSAYAVILAERESFLNEFHQGITDDSRNECQILLNMEQVVPQDSDTLFHNNLFNNACEKLWDRNEVRIISNIAQLIVPSAETLVTYGATHLKHLMVSMNEHWNESIPLTATAACPQSDFSVGFKRSAFTQNQLKKLKPFTGNILAVTKLSSFLLTMWRMYFLFFTCEVKSGAGGLDIADWQNTNSMTLAVRGIVELFKFIKHEKELHWRILSFSISHNDEAVRIYDHYPIIDGDKTTFYCHPIKKFNFTSEEGKEKWTAYKFTKNIYDVWMLDHHKLISSAINKIPEDINYGISHSDSFTSVTSVDDESELPDSQEIAASAPSSQDTVGYKKPKLPPKVMLQKENNQQKEQIDEQKDQINHLIRQVDLLKQQNPSNPNSGNKSMLQQELEQQRQDNAELKGQINLLLKQQKEFMNLLKQHNSVNA